MTATTVSPLLTSSHGGDSSVLPLACTVLTGANLDLLRDANLRELLATWDDVFARVAAPSKFFRFDSLPTPIISVVAEVASPEASALKSPLSAFEAVDVLASWSGLPAKDVVRAVGIKRRTYHSWRRSPSRRPRLESLGNLWNAYETVAGLRTELGDRFASWLHASPERLRQFQCGDFDGLALALAGETEVRDNGSRRSRTGAVGRETILPRMVRRADHAPADGANINWVD